VKLGTYLRSPLRGAPAVVMAVKLRMLLRRSLPCNLDYRQFQRWGGWWGGSVISAEITAKKQGAAGITTAAPYITGQWGRGDNRLPE
jgi:hypothetical protein